MEPVRDRENGVLEILRKSQRLLDALCRAAKMAVEDAMPMLALDCRSERDMKLNKRVREIARKENKSVADVLRAALEEYAAKGRFIIHRRKPTLSGKELGRRLTELRAKFEAEGGEFLDREELDREIAERKGWRE